MAELNVFELTNQELHKTESQTVKKSAKPSKTVTGSKRTMKESTLSGAKRGRKRVFKQMQIPANKLKFESLKKYRSILENDDEDEKTVDFTPDDDLVLVIDPDMDDVPETIEDAEAAAEELIGDHVCKCTICGANYVTDADITEDAEVEEDTCPVCGETGDQIVVGVITPMEELSDMDSAEVTDVEVDDVAVEEPVDAEDDVDADDEDDDDFGESLKRMRRRTMARRAESVKRHGVGRRATRTRAESMSKRFSTKRPTGLRARSKAVTESTVQFDEVVLNRMLTKFAKENYENVRSVKISKGSVRSGRLTLEGVVSTTKGSKRPIKFVSDNFAPSARMTLRFKEIGPFTESIKNTTATFIVECTMRGKSIIPVALKYSYKTKNANVRESKSVYQVKGSVVNESAKRVPVGRSLKNESANPSRRRSVRNRRTTK